MNIFNNKIPIAFFLFFFIFLLINPGYYWQDYNYIYENNIINSFKNYKEVSGYHTYFRPLMYFHLRFFDFFNMSEFFYNLINSLSWYLCIISVYFVFNLKDFIDDRFFLYALFPSISSAIVVSGQYITLSHAIIFITMSGFFLKNFFINRKIFNLIFFNIFFLLSLLTYEIVFVLMPLLFLITSKKKNYLFILINISVILLFFVIYNKIIIELFLDVQMDTRIRSINFNSIPIFVSNLLIALRIVLIDIFHLYLESVKNIFNNNNLKPIMLIIMSFLACCYFYFKEESNKKVLFSKKFFLIIFAILIINLVLLTVTNFPPFMHGNYNRGIIGLLFCLSIVFSTNFNNKIWKLLCYLIIFLNIISFINIRYNFEGIEKFKHIFLKDLNNIENKNMTVVLFPIGHKFNLNGEEIYETENDFNNFFYGMSLINFYNRKYNYDVNRDKVNFLLPTRACKTIVDKSLIVNYTFPLNLFLYDKNLILNEITINDAKDLYEIFYNNLNCNKIADINYYYSQSYVLNKKCSNYFDEKNKFKKFICKIIISSYSNYQSIKKFI